MRSVGGLGLGGCELLTGGLCAALLVLSHFGVTILLALVIQPFYTALEFSGRAQLGGLVQSG